jgi:cellulose biosynthesis protein BcsQ
MDPQSHCAVGLAVPEEQIEQSIYDVLISTSRNESVRISEILWRIGDKLELAPASIDLSAFEQQMAGIVERECCLKNILGQITDKYDYAIIDCPPRSSLTFNALRAASDVIVPVETGYFSLHGLSKQLETLSILCKRCNHHISVRVLASMYDVDQNGKGNLAELRSHSQQNVQNRCNSTPSSEAVASAQWNTDQQRPAFPHTCGAATTVLAMPKRSLRHFIEQRTISTSPTNYSRPSSCPLKRPSPEWDTTWVSHCGEQKPVDIDALCRLLRRNRVSDIFCLCPRAKTVRSPRL